MHIVSRERDVEDRHPGQLLALVLADVGDLHWRGGMGWADLVLALGDTADQLILGAAKAFSCSTILAVKGNHDSAAPFSAGIINAHLKRVEFSGLTFAGFAGAWKYKPRGHYLFTQDEVESALRDFPACDVFLAHNSPRGIQQRDSDFHQGFDAFNAYIFRTQPKLFLHGHQHISGLTMVDRTTVQGVYGAELVKLPGPLPTD